MVATERIDFKTISNLLKNHINDESIENKTAIEKWYSDNYEKLWGIVYDDKFTVTTQIDDICYTNICAEVLYKLDDWFDFGDEIDINDLIKEISFYLENSKKSILERQFTEYDKTDIVRTYNNENTLNKATADEVAVYKRLAIELYDKNIHEGLLAVGYGTYGGNRAFDCDFEISRKCMHALIDTWHNLPDQAFYANTLGYIYYYGRTNSGVPEYDKAFKYFTFAAHGGVYEAKYKLADMYKKGYGTITNEDMARNIIYELYDENLKYILNGQFDCKFADIALRMGNIAYERELEECHEFEQALNFYMQADFAIRMRMNENNYYGDGKVASGIKKAIEKVKNEMNFKPRKSVRYYSLSYLLGNNLIDGRWMEVAVKKQTNSYKLTFRMHKRHDQKLHPQIFISVPELEICGLYDKFSVTVKTDAELQNGTFIFDEFKCDSACFDGASVLNLPDDATFIIKRGKKAESNK